MPSDPDCGAAGGVEHSVRAATMRNGEEDLASAALKAKPDAKLEERRRAMEIAAQIVQSHLQLLQKRDVKDLAKALHVTS